MLPNATQGGAAARDDTLALETKLLSTPSAIDCPSANNILDRSIESLQAEPLSTLPQHLTRRPSHQLLQKRRTHLPRVLAHLLDELWLRVERLCKVREQPAALGMIWQTNFNRLVHPAWPCRQRRL